MKAFLFDLDGTLLDTAGDIRFALNSALAFFGLSPVELDEVRAHVGLGARRLLIDCALEQGKSLSEEEALKGLEIFLKTYEKNIANETTPFPYVLETLQHLKSEKVPMGIVTNKQEHLTQKVLESLNLSSYFSAVIGGNTLPVGKPSARPLYAALARMECLKTFRNKKIEVFMVGDSEPDALAADAANIPCLLVPYGYTAKPMNTLNGKVIEDFRALL